MKQNALIIVNTSHHTYKDITNTHREYIVDGYIQLHHKITSFASVHIKYIIYNIYFRAMTNFLT